MLRNIPAKPHLVAVLALDAVVPLDLAIPAQIFGHREYTGPGYPYAFTLCAAEAGPVPTTSGFDVHAPEGLEALERADTVIVPGYGPVDPPLPVAVAAALQDASARGARIVSICTGAFALGHAGLLDGRRATTHWRNAARLAEMFPACEVDPRVLYVDEGRLLTSAGVAAGIDLCLHLVRRDLGSEMANRVARRIVVAPQRDGGQAQFVERPLPPPSAGSLAPTRAWMLEAMATPLTVEAMAAHAGYSERSFARRFVAETGTSPLRWLQAQRVLEARRLLEATDLPVEEVAARCGFGTAAGLRVHFRRSTASSPSGYRRAWLARSATG